ncbi:MAG: hypothetical protein DI537_36810 [Stutzerimonas stutzeri]|jgi:hypothetical protein|nr:MAG: hypothetical protein DI537_36810 [Stutzerimonas stutzeri]
MPDFHPAAAPPRVPERATVTLHNETVPIATLRSTYPTLSAFVSETCFQGSEEVFPDQKSASAYFLRDQQGDAAVIVAKLNDEIAAFNAHFPAGHTDRVRAFEALGSQMGMRFLDMRLLPVLKS